MGKKDIWRGRRELNAADNGAQKGKIFFGKKNDREKKQNDVCRQRLSSRKRL